MANKGLEGKTGSNPVAITTSEAAYLNSMMPQVRQEGYTCVSGCSDCVSCGGNPSYQKLK